MAKAKAAMPAKSTGRSVVLGSWSFLIGLVLAVLLGLGLGGAYSGTLVWVVFLLGIVVGLLNVTHDEVAGFLTSGAILVLVSYLGAGMVQGVSPMLANLLTGVLTLFTPATMIVALKSVFQLARR